MSALLLFGLAACQPVADAPPPIGGFAACAAPSGTGWDNEFDAQHIDALGYVTEAAPGAAPDGCALEGSGLLVGTPSDDSAWWFEIQDQASGDLYTVAFAIPGMGAPFSIGSPLHVLWDWQPAEFQAPSGALELRTGQDLSLVWIGAGIALADLDPPGVGVEQGPTIARRDDGCGTVESYDLRLTSAGKTERVRYGETATVGSDIAHHGGVDLAVDPGDHCVDWAPDRAALAVEYYYASGNGGGGQ